MVAAIEAVEIARCVCNREGLFGNGTETVPNDIPVAMAGPTTFDGDSPLLAGGDMAEKALAEAVGDGASASSMAVSRQTVADTGAELNRTIVFASGPVPGNIGTEDCEPRPFAVAAVSTTTDADGLVASVPEPSWDFWRPGETLIRRRDGVVGHALVITVALRQCWGDVDHIDNLCGEALF